MAEPLVGAERVEIRIGDAIDHLAKMPSDMVDCVVTSPPYWGLRDYGVDGMIGLEPTLGEHIDALVSVFREVRRVLKPSGTLWLNYGDTYAGSWGAQGRGEAPGPLSPLSGRQVLAAPRQKQTGSLKRTPGLKNKDLMMLPARVALALQEDGWWIRSEIVWHKPNPMPESAKDRPTSAHEKIFLLTKSARYFYDGDAIREPASFLGPNAPDSIASPHGQGFTRRAAKGHAKGFRGGSYVDGAPGPRQRSGNTTETPSTRNARNVWSIVTVPCADAHFATFPPELARRCIAAGSPARGLILDPFGGAGTTGLVAARLGRRAILIELNPKYAEMARRRIQADWMGPSERRGFFVEQEQGPLPLFHEGAS